MKRLFDFVTALGGLVVALPVLILVMILVWLQDFRSPFYIAPRVGLGGRLFKIVKLRSMIVNADQNGIDSTSASDRRITPVGRLIRRYKLDELPQLWNVLIGDMSLVGPRPNVKRETDLYTSVERRLLTVKPGLTDFASIVFADEADILKDRADPDLAYNQLIRPWKSRLGLFYIEHAGLLLDIKLVFLTAVAIVSRATALRGTATLLGQLNADEAFRRVARRQIKLVPTPPPGSNEIVASR